MYKVIDDNGSTLARFESAADAIRYYNNNDDISSAIEPKPTDSEYQQYDVNYTAATEASPFKSSLLSLPKELPTITFPTPAYAKAPTAAEALKLIEAKNILKYGDHIKRLIDDIIEADGNIVAAPDTPRYVLEKLTSLGYTVRPGLSGHINISVYASAEVPLATQVAKLVAASEARSHVTTITHKGLTDAKLQLPVNNHLILGKLK